MGLAQAASVNTYSNGQSNVDISLDDPSTYSDSVSGSISLPEGETVNAAAMEISTDSVNYGYAERYDAYSTGYGAYLWNPLYNGGFTQYSSTSDFTEDDSTLSLFSLGYNQDFEYPVNFNVGPPINGMPENNWEIGQVENGFPINRCGSGDSCYGTDFDSVDYRSSMGEYQYELTSESVYVWSGKSSASFMSFHNLYYRSAGAGTNVYYEDCAYVMIQSSTDGSSWTQFEFLPLDLSNTTGISGGNGIYQRGTSVNQITTKCNKETFPTGASMIGGTSNNSQTASSGGWANVGLDLSPYEGEYVRLKFVLEKNDVSDPPVSPELQGWYIDALRIGDSLPQSGSVTFRTFSSSSTSGTNSPNGFGFLNLDATVPGDGSLTIDVLQPGSNNIISDRNGNTLSGLSGSIIELWDIDTDAHPSIDLRFNFNSGINRLNTPELFSFNIGTRFSFGFNSTMGLEQSSGMLMPGKWISSPMSDSYAGVIPLWEDSSFSPPLTRIGFTKTVTAIKPYVSDDCPDGTASIQIIANNPLAIPGPMPMITVANNTRYEFSAGVQGFGVRANYSSVQCELSGIHADLEFAHYASGVSLDVAGDGDIEWGMLESAFGSFGEQRMFRTGTVDGENVGSSSSTVTLTAGGSGQGATFMLPRGADVTNALIGFENNQIEDATIYVAAAAQETMIADIQDYSDYVPGLVVNEFSDFESALNDLLNLDETVVPTSWEDDFGNEWILFRMKVESATATIGSTITFRDLFINYDWQRVISDGNNLARELSQGVAMGNAVGGSVDVPMKWSSDTGGGISLGQLSITTSTGHSSTISLTNGFSGLYDDGNIYEIVTTHSVTSQGQSLSGASLLMETSRGNIELQYTISNDTFWKVSDPVDGISLAVSVTSGTDPFQINWRFRVSSEWDDTAFVQIYSSSISDTGVVGLPAATSLQPSIGNAVENDASITDFRVYNQANIEQTDLNDVKSSQSLVLTGKVRFQDLDISPDPSNYFLVLEELNTSNTQTEEWLEVDRIGGTVGGDFTWSPTLPSQTAGSRTYRFRMANFTGGDQLCPPVSYNPDMDCAIRMQVSMDPLPPQLVNISVMDGATWRDLGDNTWIPARNCQTFRIVVRDNPLAPDSLFLNYWVEKDHDTNLDRVADIGEYAQVPLVRQTVSNESVYMIDNQGTQCISDIANQGLMNSPLVSLFISGTDVGGNSVTGSGSPGIPFDLVTYQAMASVQASVSSFKVQDGYGTELTSANTTMYGGNLYHLRVRGSDGNGWGDIAQVRINLNPIVAGDMVINYWPANDTAWTDSNWITIMDLESDGVGPEMRRLDGGVLIDPFETDFILDIPIVLDWSISTVPGIVTPQVEVTDFDPNNGGWTTISSQTGNYNQRWKYSDDFKLDRSTFTVEDTIGFITPDVGNRDAGFVYPGDMLRISGQYAFSERLSDGIIINPQIPLILRIEQQEVQPDGNKGFFYAPSQVYDYPFDNGTFEILHPAPTQSNVFTFTFSLIGLPSGASDGTLPIDSIFYVNVDSEAPSAANTGSWEITDENSEEIGPGIISSTQFDCVSVKAFINERQKLQEGDVNLNWMYFKDGGNWTEFYQAFPGISHFTVPMNLDTNSDPIRASVNCVNLWNATLPSDLSGVELRFWISGTDSAGNGISGAGNYLSGFDGGVFELRYESASFEIKNLVVSDNTPAVGQSLDLIATVTNNGNKAGYFTCKVVTVVGGQVQSSRDITTPIEIQPLEDYSWRIEMGDFATPQVNVKYQIVNNDTGEVIAESTTFPVTAESDDAAGFDAATIGLIALLAILLIAVVVGILVFVRRGSDDDDDFIEDDDFLPEGEAVSPLKARSPPSRGPPGRGPPKQEETEMEKALREFTFWDENTIQGYFDMGWSIDQLRDWLAEQNK